MGWFCRIGRIGDRSKSVIMLIRLDADHVVSYFCGVYSVAVVYHPGLEGMPGCMALICYSKCLNTSQNASQKNDTWIEQNQSSYYLAVMFEMCQDLCQSNLFEHRQIADQRICNMTFTRSDARVHANIFAHRDLRHTCNNLSQPRFQPTYVRVFRRINAK